MLIFSDIKAINGVLQVQHILRKVYYIKTDCNTYVIHKIIDL